MNIKNEEIQSVCDSIKDNNYKYNFIEKNLNKINFILDEYKNKDKNFSEIASKIKEISNDIKSVYINMDRHRVEITLNDWNKIILRPITMYDWFGKLINDINYIEYTDLKEKAKELILKKKEIEKEKEELFEKIYEFNLDTNYCSDLHIKNISTR